MGNQLPEPCGSRTAEAHTAMGVILRRHLHLRYTRHIIPPKRRPMTD
jgi:hypothetical protein